MNQRTEDAPQPAQILRLRQFIRLDVMTTLVAAAVMSVVNLAAVRSVWLLIATAMVLAAGATMAAGLRPIASGDVASAVIWVAAGNWAIAIGASAIATFSWPIQQIAALLPAVLAVPYVSRRRFRVILVISVVVSVTAGGFGLLQDFTGLSGDLPGWVEPTVLIIFIPFMSLLVAQAGAGAAATLRDALDRSLEVNTRLRESEAVLAEQAELLRDSRGRVVVAADRERRRIERDLHDGAQQHLVALGLRISLARTQLATDPDAAARTLEEMRADVRRTQQEIRALVRGLYPPVLTQHGLGAALRAAVGDLDRPFSDRIQEIGRHSPQIEAALYFCGLEAMQNVMKHTPADTVVMIELRRDDTELVLVVDDRGPGFDRKADDGLGLRNMADRVGAAGGTVDVRSAPGSGTRVEARLTAR